MEKWDTYDKDRVKTGNTIERGSALAEGEYHMVVLVCLFNRSGEMLIQQRQTVKKVWPNLWDVTVGECAISGESSQIAAERGLLEELGYELDLSNVRPHLTVNFDTGFYDCYLIESDVDVQKLSLQHEEVQRVKWASKEEIIEMVESSEFVPYRTSLIELLFEMRKKYGVHSH